MSFQLLHTIGLMSRAQQSWSQVCLTNSPTASLSVSSHETSKTDTYTCLLPGSPPIWSPPSDPQAIAPDEGFRYIDQNADRYRKSSLTPIFSSISNTDSSYQFDTIDIISDRNPLRKLYAFAAHDPGLKEFRFGVSVFGGDDKKTLVFHRIEKMTREEHEEGEFHGYRTGFEAQYLRHDRKIKGAASYYKILEYQFGGLKFLVRSGVDGSFANLPADQKDVTSEDSSTGESTTVTSKTDKGSAKGKGKSHAEPSSADDKETLTIIPTVNPVTTTHGNLLELTTRSKYSKMPFDIATKLPDLYLSQTANYVEAYHHNAGYRNFMRDKTPGRFALADIKIRSMPEELKKWEKEHEEILVRYLKVVKEILEVVGRRSRGEWKVRGVWEVRYTGKSGGLEVKEAVEGAMVAMGEEIAKFFDDGESK
ncbi:MAG: hypothetical protein Q9186_000987 [Xanthomendoza sp. 1 TL-2023]